MKKVSLKNIPVTTTSHNSAGKKKQLIKNGEIERLAQFAQVTFQPGEVASEHIHPDMYEVFLIEKGKGKIRVDGKYFVMEKDMCFTIEPGESHEVTNTGSEELVITYFGIIKGEDRK